MEKEKLFRLVTELRKRLIIIAVIVILGAIVCFIFIENIRNILLLPSRGLDSESVPAFLKALWGYIMVVPEGGLEMRMIYLTPAEALMANLSLAFFSSVLITLPVILYQVVALVLSVVRHRRGSTVLFTVVMFLLFALGLAFAYCLVLPFALNFFLGFAGEDLAADFSIARYVSFMSSFLFAFGLVFQLPLIFWFLGNLGVLNTSFLRRNRKFALLIIIVFAAVLTPPDIFSQILMAIPLMILYETGIFLVYLAMRRRSRQEMRQTAS